MTTLDQEIEMIKRKYEGLENDPIYVLVGHHKGNVYATVLNSREMIG